MTTITSIEDLNLQGFQDNNLNQDYISHCHGNAKSLPLWQNLNLALGEYSKLSAVTFFFLYLTWVVERLVRADSTMLLTPSPVLSNFRSNYSSLHSGSERRDRQKISVKTNSKVGDTYRKTIIWQTCGSEAISHIAFQDPGVSVACFTQLQLNAFCSVWTVQLSSNELVCLLHQYLPMF